MSAKLRYKNGILSFESIANEDDIKIKTRVNIDPPYTDIRCNCCGRHISELRPFGRAGDSLVGDFDSGILIKKWRRMEPYDEQAENAYDRAKRQMEKEGHAGDDPLDWLIKIYGKEMGEHYSIATSLYRTHWRDWECRDCAVLNEDEYFKKQEKTKLRLAALD